MSPVAPGEILAQKYRVERVLGQGGMGIVISARHLELDQPVAIKFLLRDAPANAGERFIREAKAAALVKSEHVCRVFDVGRLESGEPYIVMEYLEGTDLADKLDADGPQSIEETVGWVVQACDALSSAHAQGIVHRDLKPANLFLQDSPDGGSTLKVVDFGISKLPTSGALTSTAVMMGSPFYMSPEQLESARDVDQRSDIWSLGVVLYELLTGVPPFFGDTIVQLAVATREREPEPASSHRPEIPAALDQIIARCLAKKPDDRYPNVNEVVVDLASFAPTDTATIVKKLTKRAGSASGRSSDPRLVLSATVSSDPKIMVRSVQRTQRDTPQAKGRSTPGAAVPSETFAPVLTDSAREQRRRVRFAAIGGVAAVAAVATLLIAFRRPPAPIAPEAAPPPPPTVVVAATSVAETLPPAPLPTPSVSVVASVPAPVIKPRTHPSASASVAAPPPPPPTVSTHGKRDLDREYTP